MQLSLEGEETFVLPSGRPAGSSGYAAGWTLEQLMREAIEFYFDALRQDGAPIPPPRTTASYVEVAA